MWCRILCDFTQHVASHIVRAHSSLTTSPFTQPLLSSLSAANNYADIRGRDGDQLRIGTQHLRNKKPFWGFVNTVSSPEEGMVTDRLYMLLRLTVRHPNKPITTITDSLMNGIVDEAVEHNFRIHPGNHVSKPQRNFARFFVSALAFNFCFDDYGPMSRTPAGFEDETAPEIREDLRHNQQVIIDHLHEIDPVAANILFPNRANKCNNEVDKHVNSLRHYVESCVRSKSGSDKCGVVTSFAGNDKWARSIWIHQFYLLQVVNLALNVNAE